LNNKIIYSLLIIISFLYGCSILPGYATRNEEVNQFIGKTEIDLRNYYGYPKKSYFNKKGNKVLVFEWNWQTTAHEPARLYTDENGRITSYEGAYDYEEYHREQRIFILDKKGNVIEAKWKF